MVSSPVNQKFSQEIVAIKAASWDSVSAGLRIVDHASLMGNHKKYQKSWLNDPIKILGPFQEMPEGWNQNYLGPRDYGAQAVEFPFSWNGLT